jgi:virginiamycin B lyase
MSNPVKCLAVAILLSIPAASFAQTFTEYVVPTPSSGPHAITVGPDGALWFTENNGNRIGRLTTAGAFADFFIPTPNCSPNGIASGSDGNLWFTEFAASANKIGRMTPTGGFTEFSVPTANSSLQGIIAGPDGNLWFAEFAGNKVGRITTAGTITEYSLPNPGGPRRLVTGPDAAIWFSEANGKIGRITTAGAITEFAVPSGGDPFGIALGPDGALWFTEAFSNRVGRVTTNGAFTEYNVSGQPLLIAAGPDNALYFAEQSGNRIGRISTAGRFADFATPTGDSSPFGVVLGPDNAVWFTEESQNRIVRMIPPPPPGAFSVSASGLCSSSTSVVRLTWSASAGAMSYSVLRNGTVWASNLTGTTYEDSAVVAGQSYTYVIRAANSIDTTDSNSVNATAVACRPDLLVSAVGVSSPSAEANQAIDVSYTIMNHGDGAAPPTVTRIRIGDSILSSATLPAIGAGASIAETRSVTLPSLDAGTYFVSVTANDDRTGGETDFSNNTSTASITVLQQCTVSCAASAPVTGFAGQPVAFALLEPPACPTAITWTFGDGTTSSAVSPSHNFTQPGSYHWTVTVMAFKRSCMNSGTITVAPAATRRRATHH